VKLDGGFVSAVGEGSEGTLHMEGGLSFEVKTIDHSRLIAYLEKGKIPIWDGVATTEEGAEIPLNGDVTTVELARLLQPFRIIFACNDGGILDKDNKAIPVVYMDNDYEDLMSANWVSQRRKIQLLQVRRIVSVVPSSCTVVVTAIESITHQLLYPRLANETIVKRAAENVVQVIENMNRVDKEKLQELIENSFGRPLVDGYLEELQHNLYRMYLITGMDGEYNGCAIITHGVKWESDTESEHSHLRPVIAQSPRSHPPPCNSFHFRQPNPSHLSIITEVPCETDCCNPNNQHNDNHKDNNVQNSNNVQDGNLNNSDTSIQDPTTDNSAQDATTNDNCTDNSSSNNDVTSSDESDMRSVSSTANEHEYFYLCKFCVRKSAQGLGLGDLLWRSLQRDIDRLYWRSRSNNPLNPWYYSRCQGSFRADARFTVFWHGDDQFEDGASLISDAIARPVTILPAPT